MLTVATLEHDRALPLDVHLRAIAELHRARRADVELGEDLAAPGHVVRSTSVQVPRRVAAVILLGSAGLGALLVQKNVLGGALPERGAYGHRREEDGLLLSLVVLTCQVRLLLAFPAWLGEVA
jgi:hypothetical protein